MYINNFGSRIEKEKLVNYSQCKELKIVFTTQSTLNEIFLIRKIN